jgi:integrase
MARKPSGPWWRADRGAYYVKLNGKQVRLDADHAKAIERFNALIAAPEVLTVAKLVSLFLADARARIAKATLVTYRCHLGKFAAVAGGLLASDVRPHHVTAWLQTREIHPNTQRTARAAVKIAWNWAEKEGLLERTTLGRLTVGASDRRRHLEESNLSTWLAAVECPCLRLWCDFGLASGLRPQEQQRLSWRDVDGRAAKVHGKGRTRVAILPGGMMSVVAELAKKHPSGPLFRNPMGRPWTTDYLDEVFRRVSKICDIRVVPYDLRHAFASRLHARGVDVLTISKLLGHATITMASRYYVHVDPSTLIHALDAN